MKQELIKFIAIQPSGIVELNTVSNSARDSISMATDMYMVNWDTLSKEGFSVREIKLTIETI